MKIRPATAADIPQLIQLAQAAPTGAQWSASQYSEMFVNQSRLVMVVEDEAVRGFLVAQTKGPEWELENIVIDRQQQRRGLATLLLNALIENAHQSGAHSLFLEVRASNNPARAFYTRNKFRETGRRPRYYNNPTEDAILYTLGMKD
ncbi:MAG TPA: ribosomal protein S18-alanine N-acetyltransferase [Terriglobales bacterium]|nr:ribosomal protein S18-alanine N-acetyltransferase [Terriglobales bacterium]